MASWTSNLVALNNIHLPLNPSFGQDGLTHTEEISQRSVQYDSFFFKKSYSESVNYKVYNKSRMFKTNSYTYDMICLMNSNFFLLYANPILAVIMYSTATRRDFNLPIALVNLLTCLRQIKQTSVLKLHPYCLTLKITLTRKNDRSPKFLFLPLLFLSNHQGCLVLDGSQLRNLLWLHLSLFYPNINFHKNQNQQWLFKSNIWVHQNLQYVHIPGPSWNRNIVRTIIHIFDVIN